MSSDRPGLTAWYACPLAQTQTFSIIVFNCCAGTTPDCRHFTTPFLKMISVGTDCTLYAIAACWFLSTSIFTIFTSSLVIEASSFNIGAIILHGPHHSAEKSTSTVFPELIRSLNFDIHELSRPPVPNVASLNFQIFSAVRAEIEANYTNGPFAASNFSLVACALSLACALNLEPWLVPCTSCLVPSRLVWFPQFHLIPLWIHYPPKYTILRVLNLSHNRHAFFLQFWH